MCGGASDQEKESYAAQQGFFKTLQAAYTTAFGEQQGILKTLTDKFTPILNAGPNQEGFSEEEKRALNTRASEGMGTNYANAGKALNEQMAARGSGTAFLPSGADEQVRGQLAASAAGELSREQNEIQLANYAQGREEFNAAAGVLGKEAATINPIGYADAASQTGANAGKVAMDISQQQNSWMAPVFGAVGGVLSSAVKV